MSNEFSDLPVLLELREHLESHISSTEPTASRTPRRRRWFHGRARLAVIAAGIVLLGGSAAGGVSLLETAFPGEPPLPSDATVLAIGRAPGIGGYVLAVTPSSCAGWAHVELRSANLFTTGGCGQPINTTADPQVFAGGCVASVAVLQGTISAQAQSVRARFADGHVSTIPVEPFPANVGIHAGAFLLVLTPADGKLVSLEAFASDGHQIGTAAPPPTPGCAGE
jgi:hypothetical protein